MKLHWPRHTSLYLLIYLFKSSVCCYQGLLYWQCYFIPFQMRGAFFDCGTWSAVKANWITKEWGLMSVLHKFITSEILLQQVSLSKKYDCSFIKPYGFGGLSFLFACLLINYHILSQDHIICFLGKIFQFSNKVDLRNNLTLFWGSCANLNYSFPHPVTDFMRNKEICANNIPKCGCFTKRGT